MSDLLKRMSWPSYKGKDQELLENTNKSMQQKMLDEVRNDRSLIQTLTKLRMIVYRV